jgi:hypothetical protein
MWIAGVMRAAGLGLLAVEGSTEGALPHEL